MYFIVKAIKKANEKRIAAKAEKQRLNNLFDKFARKQNRLFLNQLVIQQKLYIDYVGKELSFLKIFLQKMKTIKKKYIYTNNFKRLPVIVIHQLLLKMLMEKFI